MAGLEGVYWDEEGQQYVPEEPKTYKIGEHYVDYVNYYWFWKNVDARKAEGMSHNDAYNWAMSELEGRIAVGTVLDYGLDVAMMLMTAGGATPLVAATNVPKAVIFAEKAALMASKRALRVAKMAIPVVKRGVSPYLKGIVSEEVDPAYEYRLQKEAKAVTAAEKKARDYQVSQWEKLEKTKAKIVTKPKVVASIIEKYEKQHGVIPVVDTIVEEKPIIPQVKTITPKQVGSVPLLGRKVKLAKAKTLVGARPWVGRIVPQKKGVSVGKHTEAFLRKRSPLSRKENLKRQKYEQLRRAGISSAMAYEEIRTK